MQCNEVLEQLNFSKKEISVYISLLELDTATATEIAKKTDINRTSCYDLLAVLIKKGLVSKFKKKNKIYFHAGDPRRLLSYLEREKQDKVKTIEKQQKLVEEIIPELSSVLNPQSTKPKVEFFEGQEGMKEAYEDTLNSKTEIRAYANIETMHQSMPNFFPEYYKKRVKKNIKGRGIFPNNKTSLERSKKNISEMRQTIVLGDKNIDFTPEMLIYNNKVLLVSWLEKIAVSVESEELTKLQKVVFDLVWKGLKKDNTNISSP
ncbi:MAG: helix-turn-helix domain-containing protein [bacterium]